MVRIIYIQILYFLGPKFHVSKKAQSRNLKNFNEFFKNKS